MAQPSTHWVVDFGAGQGRWTQAQQRAYAEGLLALLRDQARDVPALRFAITTLARLAFADASAILPFAADTRPPLREIAVRALPWLDAGQGVPVLIECLGDDRARHAIYALRKSFAEMPRERVLAQLRAVPTGKVTVAKEVVRLYGELGGEDAYRELLALDRRSPPLHRDVRIALLRALWDHLERGETWAVLQRAAADPDWVLASRLTDLPLGRLSLAAEALQRLSAQDLLHADAMGAALSAIQGSLHPDLVERRLAQQGDPRLRRLALEALLAAARPERGWTPERRQRLETYRRDPVPGVAGPAAFVFPPE